MKLIDLLDQYKQLPILDRMLYTEDNAVSSFLKIQKKVIDGKVFYEVFPSKNFDHCTGSIASSIRLDEHHRLVDSSCGCLEFYRKKGCVHTTLLYALALKSLDKKKFESVIENYRYSKLAKEHCVLLNQLADELRTNSAYFKKIHLTPEINKLENSYYLSLHIGYDKEYIVKSISELISNMENNKYYSYGQKLAFVHSYEVLDNESKEFYSFLLNIVHEDSLKNIKIKRSHFLKILEIYHRSGIYFADGNQKNSFHSIVDVKSVPIILDGNHLFIQTPEESKMLTCGVNYAYFIGNGTIYAYCFQKRNEAIIFDTLFKCDETGLCIEANQTDFISNLLPVIKNEVKIQEDFYKKYSLPTVEIHSYFTCQNGVILNHFKILVEEKYKETPYVAQILDGYLKCLEAYQFVQQNKDVYSLSSLEYQYAFLTSDISAIKNYGEVFFDEAIKRITLKNSNHVDISISYHVGLLNFDIHGGNLTIEEIQAMLQAYHHKRKFVRLKNDTILQIKEEDAKNLDNFLEDFNIDVKNLGKTIKKPLNYILKLVNTDEKDMICDDKIVEMIHQIQNYKNIKDEPKNSFLQVLRPYQLEGFKWLRMLSKFGFGGILADDMGLGKTLEIISFLGSDEKQAPTLIVCPMSLIYNWENECEKWHLSIPVRLIIGQALEREEMIKGIDYQKKAIYITSYDSLRRDIEFYVGTFRFVVADEAQYIKNQNALKSEAIKQIKSEMNFALTGTPIENGLADLWNIFDYLMPGYLTSYARFKSRYESLIMHDDLETLELLKKRVQPFILRRTKKDVLKELPDKIEEIYYCKMEDEQAKIYDSYVSKIKSELKNNTNQLLALITRLRQICITPQLIYEEEVPSAKLALALELVTRAISSNHRVLIFSQFASVFPILAPMLDGAGISYFIMDGTTKAARRMEMVDHFNQQSDIKVFMISLKAGGTGLNLTGADMVIHLDPWWNVSVENQATDRAYRIGQTKNVHVMKLVCKNTIEEKVLELQKLKRSLADSIILSENENIKLTKAEILELLD